MKYFLIVIGCLCFITVKGQEVVLSFKNEELSKRITKDSYTMVNSETNDLAIVIIERKDVIAYLFDSDLKKVSKLSASGVKSKFNKVLGYRIKDRSYDMLYTNEKQTKFALFSLNFESKTSQITEIEPNLPEGHLFLDAINYNNDLFILSGNNNSELSLSSLDESNGFSLLKTFALDEINEETSLITSKFRIGVFLLSGYETANVSKIDSRSPTSIERASSNNKLYQNEEKVYLTFDNNGEATILYTIDLESLELNAKTYPYPKGKIEDFKKHNSFLFEDYLFQMGSSKKEMSFVIKDFNEGQTLKEFYVNRDMPIDFKNTPIIQEGQTVLPFVTTRKLEQTQKYLRKISSGNLGITVQKVRGLFYVTLGGYEIINTGSITPMVGTPNINASGLITYNPTYLSYHSYSYTKSTYFNTILNVKFDHLKGDLSENKFDLISTYKDQIKYETAEDVFYYNGSLHFGFYNLKEQTYNLINF